jgi:thiol-disulfide isomerase/thioredoxin
MSVALAAVGGLCLVNLALLFAVIRKVRVLGERVDKVPVMAPAALLPVGSPAPEFTAITTNGDSRSLADLAGSRSVVGFFSPNCPPCRIQVPEFIDFAAALPGGGRQSLAVVVGEGEAATGLAAELDGAAAVVITPRMSPLTAAFSVRGFPAFYLVGPGGRIEAQGMAIQALASSVLA